MEVFVFAVSAVVALLISIVLFLYRIFFSLISSLSGEAAEKRYWEKLLNSRNYNELRDIYNNPYKVHEISKRKLKKYLEILIRGVPPLSQENYTRLIVLFLSSRKITKKQLIWLWEISGENYTIKSEIAKHPSLPEDRRALYALELLSNQV